MACEKQWEELRSIEAIYDGDTNVVISLPKPWHEEPSSVGSQEMELDAILALEVSEPVTVSATASSESILVQELPLWLHTSLPPEYLNEDSGGSGVPQVTLHAPWLSSQQLRHLECELHRQGWDRQGEHIIFVWIEWLRAQSWEYLKFTSEANAQPSEASDVEQCQKPSPTSHHFVLTLDGFLEVSTWKNTREQEIFVSFQQQCASCNQVLPGSSCALLEACGHVLCSQCLRLTSHLHVASGQSPKCPLPHCRTPIPSTPGQMAQKLQDGDMLHIMGSSLEELVVFCLRCEDLGVDTPVLFSGGGDGTIAGASEACRCYKCDWVFCSVCRSPYHPTEACVAHAGRAARMLRRKPPLSAKSRAAAEAVQAVAPALAITREQANKAAEAAKAAAGTPKKTVAEAKKLENALLKRLKADDQRRLSLLTDGPEFVGVSDTHGVPRDFDNLRWWIWSLHSAQISQSLKGCFEPVRIRPAPLAQEVCKRFMQRVGDYPSHGRVLPAFHGTDASNHSSIFARGLLVPGESNELRVVHGAAHGTGVYTAKVDAAWLSRGFCTKPRMLVCAVLDSDDVRHVGDAMVVRRSTDVVPLFEAFAEDFKGAMRSHALPTRVSLPPRIVPATPAKANKSMQPLRPVTEAKKQGPVSRRLTKTSAKAVELAGDSLENTHKKNSSGFAARLAARTQKRK